YCLPIWWQVYFICLLTLELGRNGAKRLHAMRNTQNCLATHAVFRKKVTIDNAHYQKQRFALNV
ncbi:MAG: hypothetical protein RR068_13560, partial [Hafnia sp.]